LTIVLWAHSAIAADATILVGKKGTKAAEHAATLADDKTVFAATKLHAAFAKASELLVSCKTCTVTIKVAAGAHEAKGNTGTWAFPDTVAPDATLRILGGWDARFEKRTPFATPSALVVVKPRSAAVIQFEGKKHALKELVFSGFVIDVSPGNNYDAKTNSLLKGTSSSHAVIAFGYLTTDKLVIADNVFMNAANGVGGPLIRAASAGAEVHVVNNLFLNNVMTWVVGGGGGKNTTKRYVIQGNTFALNFPYNPDATTSNPGTVEIGNKYSAASVELTGNLFAYNAGGAIFPQWDDKDGPKIAIKDNLFWKNGALFEAKTPAHGAVVGKFNRAAKHSVYDADELEEDFSWDVKGNVSFDPKLAIPVLKMKAVGQKAPAKEEKKAEEEEDSAEDYFGVETEQEDIEVDQDVEMDEYADEGSIKNYAPRMPFNLDALPFPGADKAKKYGASPARVGAW
jgi:hypothetical protein